MTKVTSKYIELCIIKIEDGKIKFLLLKRAKNQIYPNIWQMVTGKIRKNENAVKTALRELKEETSLIPKELYVVPIVNSLYLYNSDEVIFIPVFLAVVDGNSDVKISDEHSEFRWVTASYAKKMVNWEGQKKAIEIIEKYFLKSKDKFTKVDLKNIKMNL